jgi:hypothetical protein
MKEIDHFSFLPFFLSLFSLLFESKMEKNNKQISEPLLNSTEDIQEDIILDNEWSSKRNPHQSFIVI